MGSPGVGMAPRFFLTALARVSFLLPCPLLAVVLTLTFEKVLLPQSDVSFSSLYQQPLFMESLIVPPRTSDQDPGSERAGRVSGILSS